MAENEELNLTDVMDDNLIDDVTCLHDLVVYLQIQQDETLRLNVAEDIGIPLGRLLAKQGFCTWYQHTDSTLTITIKRWPVNTSASMKGDSDCREPTSEMPDVITWQVPDKDAYERVRDGRITHGTCSKRTPGYVHTCTKCSTRYTCDECQTECT